MRLSLHGLVALFVALLALQSHAWLDPDVYRDLCGVVKDKGYPCEVHYVTTDDGYILTTFRIPHGLKNGSLPPKRPPVLLFHGLIDDSFTWVVNLPHQSLAYLMADHGYDVWLGNARGNRFALNHTRLSVKDAAFWDFTWDQQAAYDLPNTVDYLLTQTGASSTFYVGHSQGTTQALAAFSSNHVLTKKIVSFGALAPVATVGHMNVSGLLLLQKLHPLPLVKALGIHDFLGPTLLPSPIQTIINYVCWLSPYSCDTVIEIWVGPVISPMNDSRTDVIVAHEPGGTSVLNMEHWIQMLESNRFQAFNWGTKAENQKRYGQPTPPVYNVTNIPATLPIAVFTGDLDELADPIDFRALIADLPVPPKLHVNVPTFGHLDFVWALNADKLIYEPLIKFFEPLKATIKFR